MLRNLFCLFAVLTMLVAQTFFPEQALAGVRNYNILNNDRQSVVVEYIGPEEAPANVKIAPGIETTVKASDVDCSAFNSYALFTSNGVTTTCEYLFEGIDVTIDAEGHPTCNSHCPS